MNATQEHFVVTEKEAYLIRSSIIESHFGDLRTDYGALSYHISYITLVGRTQDANWLLLYNKNDVKFH